MNLKSVFFLHFLFAPLLISAQHNSRTQAPTSPISPTDIERRILELELAQKHTIESLKSSHEYNKFLIQMIGGFIGVLVAIQGISAVFQVRRERERDKRQMRREEEGDKADRSGV